ncbi:hypothetical protein [Vreelandella titanicae]|uniref:hypothetical protein n=1 Tax=Vreelandella titanicae TaxID=664683 RepID=UPI0037F1E80C
MEIEKSNYFIDSSSVTVELGEWTLVTSGSLQLINDPVIIKFESLVFKFIFKRADDVSARYDIEEVDGALEIRTIYSGKEKGGFVDLMELAHFGDKLIGIGWEFKPFSSTKNKNGIKFSYSFFIKEKGDA